jgi:hypothetical protein
VIKHICAIAVLTAGAMFAQGDQAMDDITLASRKPNIRFVPLQSFSFKKDLGVTGGATIAFDGSRAYVSSPDGSVLTTTSLNSSSAFNAIFQSDGIFKVYVYDHALYVIANPEPVKGTDPKHALFQSKDGAKSFQTIDSGLKECFAGYCGYLPSKQLLAVDNLLYVNAGAGNNLLLSRDEGVTWTALSGAVESMVCYYPTFEIVGRTVLQGGECPLDSSYLNIGRLSKDKLSLKNPLEPSETPNLSNRQIMAIQHKPGTSVVLAGAEGALLRSTDDGQSFDYVFEHPAEGDSYPYVQHILFSSRYRDAALIGGFDKATEKPFLAYGTGQGRNWTDISAVLGKVDVGYVSDIAEDAAGRLIVVVTDENAKTVTIAEVQIQP